MEGIEFEEQKQNDDAYTHKVAFLPSLVIRYSRGKVETENQANLVLLIVIIIIFTISLFIIFSSDKTSKVQEVNIKGEVIK